MPLLLGILGLGTLALIVMIIVDGDYLYAAVPVTAVLTFLGIWLWKRRLGPEAWNKRPTSVARQVKQGIGLILFAAAMVQLGVIVRTLWANHFGEASHSVDLGNIFSSIIMATISLALIGYERMAAILFMTLWFSTTLAFVFLHSLAGQNGEASGIAWASAFVAAFLIVVALGRWFHWSKGFALAGLVGMFVGYLSFYLTM